MASTPRSRKSKGRRLQNDVRDSILKLFEGVLEQDDVQSAIMGESGTDVKLSPLARRLFPYSVECKNQEKMNIWASLKQAEENVKDGTTPILIFKRNHTKTYVTMEYDKFLELIKDKQS